jgi:diguanylate cyclase (GGDEF)-like protein
MFSMDFRAGTLNTPEGKAVIDRLDRGISELSDNQVQAVVMDYTSRHLYRADLWDYLYEHRFLMAVLAVFLWMSITGIVHRQRAVRKKQEKKIRELVERDPLTGALSLEGFKTRVEELLTEHPENQYLLLFSNIKNFKYINETMSRETGDQILKFWVKIATEYFTDEDAIGRITGDRFAVLRKYTGEDQIQRDMREVIDPIKSFFIDRGRELTLQVCTGIYALQPEDYRDKDVDRMLDYARMAEKRVRNTQKTGFEFYNSEQWEKGKQIVNISGHLPIALKNEEIQVWYQPQVDYKTGLICGAEALCRWNHDKLGWISPAVFIPTLEETGLIYDLDCYIWDKVCQDLHRWNEQGEHRSISVNLSRSDIRGDRDIPEYFFDLLKKYDLTPDQLRIEITESAFVENKELLIRTTNELHDCGFQVEMDDFGSGYSSLNMLKEVPVDRIKMDLHFLTDSGDKKKSEIIIEQVIILVEKLGMKLIAEGVENDSQASFLGERGCEEMQGYHFFKPMPVEDFEATWRENHKG